MLEDAARVGVDRFEIRPSDLSTPRPRLTLAFVAALMGTLPGLDGVDGIDLKDIMHGEEDNDREERTFRMWMTSLGLDFTINNLVDDCRTGIPLLRIEDHLQPGSVEWRRVNMKPTSIYLKVENCNYACDVAKRQQMKAPPRTSSARAPPELRPSSA